LFQSEKRKTLCGKGHRKHVKTKRKNFRGNEKKHRVPRGIGARKKRVPDRPNSR